MPTVEELRRQRAPRDLAYLQTHQAGQENQPQQSADAPAEVPHGHLCVSLIDNNNKFIDINIV